MLIQIRIILLCSLIFAKTSMGQTFVDSCFTSVSPVQSNSFVSSTTLANVANSDVLEWDGNSWIGGFPDANITIPPPINASGCRVIFVGSTIHWTTSGESFGILLTNPLESGQDYSISFTYVSHGTGSNGNFSPFFYTSPSPNMGPAYLIGNLPSVGYTWTTNTVSFTATDEQAGHSWFILGTQPNGSSGLINSFCSGCNEINCSVDLGNNITICEGDSVTLDATIPNATYLWQDNSTDSTFNVTEPGLYWVEVTLDICYSVDSILVEFSPPPTLDIGPDTTLCQGETITLDATTPSATYLWQDNSNDPIFTVSEQGAYWVEVTVNNCSSLDSVFVDLEPLPAVDIGSDTTLCEGESITLNATTLNATYLWQDNSTDPTFNVTEQGTYWVEITADYCSSSDTIFIDFSPLPTVELGSDTSLCEGASISLDATTPNATYLWQNDSNEPTFGVSEEGIYSVEVTVDNCSSVDSVFVDFSPYPTVDFGPDTTLCIGESFTLNATTPNATYLWQDNSTNPTFSVTESGVFWVEVAVNNCSSIAMTSIEFEDCEIVLEIPNVFTPNNDGSNDVFMPIVSKGITSMTTQVYNRWGNKIFETNNPSIEWQGDMVSEGTYFWIIYYTTRKGTEDSMKGYVTLLK